MKHKKFIIGGFIIIALILVSYGVLTYQTGEGARAQINTAGNVIADFQGEKVAIDTSTSTLEFEGFKPTGSHLGTFENWQGNLYIENDQVIGIEGTAHVTSVKTDSSRVDSHLQTEDFFDAANYPTIEFRSTSFDKSTNMLTGELTFHGITNEITFPVTRAEDTLSAEFYIDTTPFQFKYIGINKEVRIKTIFRSVQVNN